MFGMEPIALDMVAGGGVAGISLVAAVRWLASRFDRLERDMQSQEIQLRVLASRLEHIEARLPPALLVNAPPMNNGAGPL